MMDGLRVEKNSKYKGLKIATIYGQGMENCGVTRTHAELKLWAEKNECIAHVYAYTRKYSRDGAHDIGDIHYFGTPTKNNGAKTLLETAKYINNNYDIVMFMNYPNAKSDLDYYSNFYFELFQNIHKPQKAVYIHEIRGAQFNRLAYLVPMIVNADIIFHFDITTTFSKAVDKLGIQKAGDRLRKYTLWMNFDDLNTWRHIYLNKKTLGVVSVTRWSSSKNVRRTIDIMDRVQRLKPEWNCQIHGIERSMGAKIDVIDYEKTIYNNGNGKKDNEENGTINVYGPVNRNVGIDIVAKHMFSTAFWSMPKDPENYSNRMEYSQIEIIGVGTIPILDRHWGENNYTKDGRRYIDILYSAIYIGSRDEDEIKTVVEQLISIAENPEILQKYLDTSHALVVQEFEADNVIPEAIDVIQSVGKNTNQMTIFEICKKFVNIKFAEEMQKLGVSGKQPVYNIDAFQNGHINELLDKKESFVKKIKKSKGGKPKNLF